MGFKTLEGERWPSDVPTQALKTLSVAAVHGHRRVDVNAADFRGGTLPCRVYEAKWAHELRGLTASRWAKQLNIGGRRAVTRREDRLVACERVAVEAVEAVDAVEAIDASAVPLQHSEQTRVSPCGDLRDVLRRQLGELAKLQLSRIVPHVHSVERQRVKVHIQPERAVGALHERERAHLRIAYRAQAELALRSPPQRALQRADERAQNVRGRLQDAARSLLQGESAQRFGREGRLTRAELSSEFETTSPSGHRSAFNVDDAAGFEGEYKCNIFAFEMARRAGFQTPLQGRPHGWGYPAPDTVTATAATGRLPRDWGRVVTGESAEALDANLRAGERGLMLSSAGTDGHAGHMAVVERIHEIRYDEAGEISQVVFDGWEARSRGARHLTERTWNRVGTRGGEDPRGGLSRIEIIELLAPREGGPEMPISSSAGPSRHD